ncbi:MAG TPA: 30S ribosomal protein S18 [Anaerolineales bacterium]|nr:30S ribosomal protein S18 [Anaerolineales bacterium]
MAEERERRPMEGGEGGGDRRFFAKPKFCQFCADKTLTIDYKKTDLLKKYINEDGKIRPRRQTGACAKHQRVVAAAVKQARYIALLPFTGKRVEETR